MVQRYCRAGPDIPLLSEKNESGGNVMTVGTSVVFARHFGELGSRKERKKKRAECFV